MIVKSIFLLWFVSLAVVSATPDGFTRVTEKILGSGKEGFAVIRFEEVNPGSYYNWDEKTYLDEYQKGNDGRERVKSTLLTHMTFSYPDADPQLPVERKEVARDSTLQMGALLANYQVTPGREWDVKEVEELKFVSKVGLCLEGFGTIVAARNLKKEYGEEGIEGLKVNKVQRDAWGGGLFIEITDQSVDHDAADWQIRQVYVPEPVATQIRHYRKKEEIYLMVGEFPVLTEAQAFVAKLQKTVKEERAWMNFEIWTKAKRTEELFRVVIADSGDAIRNERHLVWEEKIRERLIPVSGTSLWRKETLASE